MTAILQAGGPNDRAKLDEIHIIRPRADGSAEVFQIDLNKFIKEGNLASNPPLRPGDTVSVAKKGFTSQELTTVLAVITTLATLTLLFLTIQDEFNQNNQVIIPAQ